MMPVRRLLCLSWVGLLGCAGGLEPSAVEQDREGEPAVIVEHDAPAQADEEVTAPQPEAVEQSEPAEPEPLVFEQTTRGSGACVVTLVALLEAENYRGAGPITPALEATMAADPDFARMWESESHGDHHIQCHYEVRLGSRPQQRYRWRVVHNNTLRDRTPEICKRELGQIAEDIIRTTEQCTQLAAGAYYGYVLEPM